MAQSALTTHGRKPEGAEPAPRGGAERRAHEDQDADAEVLAVEVDLVAAPVVVEHPGELREVRVEEFLDRHRELRGEVVAAAPAGARRPGHVFLDRQELHGADDEAQHHGAQRIRQPPEGHVARQASPALVVAERHEQRECSRAEQHVLRASAGADSAPPARSPRRDRPTPIGARRGCPAAASRGRAAGARSRTACRRARATRATPPGRPACSRPRRTATGRSRSPRRAGSRR